MENNNENKKEKKNKNKKGNTGALWIIIAIIIVVIVIFCIKMCNSKDTTTIRPEFSEKTTQIEETPKADDSVDALKRDKSNRNSSNDSSYSTLAHPSGYNNEVPTDDKLDLSSFSNKTSNENITLESLKSNGK